MQQRRNRSRQRRDDRGECARGRRRRRHRHLHHHRGSRRARLFNGADGFLGGDVAGKLFIEMSTLQPMTARELAPLVEAKGARLIDSPVLGTIPQVRDGKLFALVGGQAEDFERARRVLELLTRRIMHMGPAGSGYRMKPRGQSWPRRLYPGDFGIAGARHAAGPRTRCHARRAAGSALCQRVMKSKIGVIKGETPDMTLDIRTLRKDIMSAGRDRCAHRCADADVVGHAGFALGRCRQRQGLRRSRRIAAIPARADGSKY